MHGSSEPATRTAAPIKMQICLFLFLLAHNFLQHQTLHEYGVLHPLSINIFGSIIHTRFCVFLMVQYGSTSRRRSTLRPCSVILDSFRAGNNRYYKKHTVGTTKYWDLFRAGNYFVAISSQPEINSGLLLYLLFPVLNESHITE